MKKYSGYENWDVKFHSDTYLQTFPKDKLIYLTSDSDQVINEIDPSFVYIIGGLVDHNAHKVNILIRSHFVSFHTNLKINVFI